MYKFISLIAVLVFSTFLTHASETAKGARKDFENFKAEMSTKLDNVEKEIGNLRTQAAQKESAAQEATLKDLETTRTQLKAELERAKEGGKNSWSKFKKNFAESVDKLNSKIQKAIKD